MNHKDALDKEEVINFVMSCWDEEAGLSLFSFFAYTFSSSIFILGAFGSHPDHDAHLLPTLCAVQILITYDALDRLDIPRVVECASCIHPSVRDLSGYLDVLSLQQPSGVFAGDSFGEIDTRFLCCAVLTLSLLSQLDKLDVDKTVSYIRQCKNFDGGYGNTIGAESHAGQGRSCRPLRSQFVVVSDIAQFLSA
jgi:geranylgeranyl transferase type-2 subunit beta